MQIVRHHQLQLLGNYCSSIFNAMVLSFFFKLHVIFELMFWLYTNVLNHFIKYQFFVMWLIIFATVGTRLSARRFARISSVMHSLFQFYYDNGTDLSCARSARASPRRRAKASKGHSAGTHRACAAPHPQHLRRIYMRVPSCKANVKGNES